MYSPGAMVSWRVDTATLAVCVLTDVRRSACEVGGDAGYTREKDDTPRYILGHALELAFIGAGILALLVLVFNYK